MDTGNAGSRVGIHRRKAAVVLAAATLMYAMPGWAVPAFPSAQGAGAGSAGGRGGTVFIVTSLADAGPGTLRECVESRVGPRSCVFAVGGTIELESELYVDRPFLTVAGQTAPGGGILLTSTPNAVLSSLVSLATHDIVWQYMRLRQRYHAACSDGNASECGALFAAHGGSYNIIADHNSLSWNQDEAYGVWRGGQQPVRDMTFSNSLIAEGLQSHSTGMIVGGSTSALSADVTNIDMHHNLVMNNNHRNPLFKHASGRVINNVFYNQRFYVAQMGGGGRFDIIGNAFLRGPMTANSTFHEVQAFSSSGADAYDGSPSIYLAANDGWNTGDQWQMASRVTGENGRENGPVPAAWRRTETLPATTYPIVVDSVDSLVANDGRVVQAVGAAQRLDCNGNWVGNRDAVDTRLIAQFLNNSGITRLPTTEADGGGLPDIASGDACADSDADGMPDAWESAFFGSLDAGPQDDHDNDGYSNIEEYWQGQVALPTTVPTPATEPTPTPTATATPTSTPIPSPSPQPTATVTPVPTPIPTATPAPTASATPTVVVTPTATAVPSVTTTPIPTATAVPTTPATPTVTQVPTPSATAAPRATPTVVVTPAPTAVVTPTTPPLVTKTPIDQPTLPPIVTPGRCESSRDRACRSDYDIRSVSCDVEADGTATLAVTVKNNGSTRLPGASVLAVVQELQSGAESRTLRRSARRRVLAAGAEETIAYRYPFNSTGSTVYHWEVMVRDGNRDPRDRQDDFAVCEASR